MARRAVDELILTQRAIDKARVHGVTDAQMEAVVANANVLARNRKGRAASHVLIGRDDQGRCIAIPVVRADRPGSWWAITAWSCKPSELAKLR